MEEMTPSTEEVLNIYVEGLAQTFKNLDQLKAKVFLYRSTFTFNLSINNKALQLARQVELLYTLESAFRDRKDRDYRDILQEQKILIDAYLNKHSKL